MAAETRREGRRGIKHDFIQLLEDIFDASGEKGYKKFLFFLIFIDLTWFASVVSDNLFGLSLGDYGETAWTFLFGMGLIIFSDVKRVIGLKRQGFKSQNFASLATFIIGVLALFTSVMSLPQINVESPVMNAVKGILGLIAIIYVILEAWIVKS